MGIKVKLVPWQAEVVEDPSRFKVVDAGRRAGKSVLARMWILSLAVKKPGLYWIVSPTYAMCKDIHWKQGMLQEIPSDWVDKKNESELEITLKNGSRIALKSSEHPDRLRGVKLRGLVVDEIASMRNWDSIWQEVLRPTLSDYEAPAMFISTPAGYNHFYELWEVAKSLDNWNSWKFTSYDNPKVPKTEIDAARNELDEDTFAQEYMAEFKQFKGLVYKDFSRERHVVAPKELMPDWNYYRGIDFGFVNPSAVIYACIDDKGVINVYDEIYRANVHTPELADLIKQKSGQRMFVGTYGDSAQMSDIAELQRYGIGIEPVSKTSGSHTEDWSAFKIRRVTEKIKGDKLRIFSNCKHTIEEFETYQYVEANKNGMIKEIPLKKDDHCFVAGTLIKTKRGSVPIEDITTNDYVWTPFGWSEVYRCGLSGEKEVKDYGVFECTPDHKIFTERGLKEIDALTYDDTIMLCHNRQRPSSSRGYLTGGIRVPIIPLIRFILGGVLTKGLEARQDFYTEMYGNTLRGRFLRGTRYITLMVTLLITILKISSFSILRSIKKGTQRPMRVWKSIWRRFALLQRNGIRLRKENNGTASMRGELGETKSSVKKSVRNVEPSIRHISLKEAGSVIQTVKLGAGEEDKRRKRVYNLATKNGLYFANDILVSNCMDALAYMIVSMSDYMEPTNDVTYQKLLQQLPQENLFNEGYYG